MPRYGRPAAWGLFLASLASACSATPPPVTEPATVDITCRVDADCAVKDVGNCCGYYPACVNKDSSTFPDRVKAECEAKGISSICGFPEIAGCTCVDRRCAPASDSLK